MKPLGYQSGEWVFCKGCDSGLLGWYVMFCEGQYAVESRANCLGRADMQVPLTSASEQSRSPAERALPSGRIQAHVLKPQHEN